MMALRADDARCAGDDGGCATDDGPGLCRRPSSARSAIIAAAGGIGKAMTRCALMTPAALAMMAATPPMIDTRRGRRIIGGAAPIIAAAGGIIHHGIRDLAC